MLYHSASTMTASAPSTHTHLATIERETTTAVADRTPSQEEEKEKKKPRVWATLLTVPSYLPGTLTLAASLRASGSRYPLVAMVIPELPDEAHAALRAFGISSVEVPRLNPQSEASAVQDKRFADTWTKLSVFRLVQYERVVLLDSDMVVRHNMDELLEMDLSEDSIAAAHACACNPRNFPHYPKDWTPENCAYNSPEYPPAYSPDAPRAYGLLNSGCVALAPSLRTYDALVHFLETSPLVPDFLFPDQDLLAEYFRGRWKPLPYIYNGLKTLRIIHSALWRDEEVKCVHYILTDKPWMTRPKEGQPLEGKHAVLNQWWWDAYIALWKMVEASGPDEQRRALEYTEGYLRS